jgi:hypothetical protein
LLAQLLGPESEVALRAHPQHLAARELPHEVLAVVVGARRLHQPPQLDFFKLDLEGKVRSSRVWITARPTAGSTFVKRSLASSFSR